MKLGVYTVLDKAVGAFLQPFFARSTGEALRSFGDAVNGQSGPFSNHPHDFTLYQLGDFDDGSGIFTVGEPHRIVGAHELLTKLVENSAAVGSA